MTVSVVGTLGAWLLSLPLLFAPPPATPGATAGPLSASSDTETGETETSDTETGETETGETETSDTDTETSDSETSDSDTGGVQIDPEPNSEPGTGTPSRAPAPVDDPDTPITVTTRLTPDPAHIGDLLTLEVIVAYPSDHTINLPNGLDFSPLELRSITPGEVESTGSGQRQRFTIELQHFALGEASVPSFPVTWIDPDEAVHTYSVAPHTFVVESLLANESEPERRGEDPPLSLEYPNVRLAMILYGLLGGAALAGLSALAWLRWRRRERPIVLPPPVPAHERAFADLETLAGESEALIADGAYQDYYLRLTEIAKRYLGARFGFEALDRTTEEIQALFDDGEIQIDPLDPAQISMFLQDCDLVKFARLSPPAEEALAALDVVYDMVDVSKVAPELELPANAEPKPAATEPERVTPEPEPVATEPEPAATEPQPVTPEPEPKTPEAES